MRTRRVRGHEHDTMSDKPSSSSTGGEAPPAQGYVATPHYPTADIPVAAGYPTTNGEHFFYPAGYHHTPRDLGIYDGRVFSPESQQYTSNLFDCTDDMETCCYGTFCTVCQIGESASQAKAGDCCATSWCLVGLAQLNHVVPLLGSLIASGFLANTANRAALNYGITEHTDVLTACFCGPCVSCRLAREVKAREQMGQQPVDVLGHMRYGGGMIGPGGNMLFPTAPVMVRTTQPPQEYNIMNGPGRDGGGGGGGVDSMVTYVAVTQPQMQQPAPPNYHQPQQQQQQQGRSRPAPAAGGREGPGPHAAHTVQKQ